MSVSFAPLLTDGPVILAGFFLLHLFSNARHLNLFLSAVSFFGAAFLLYLAINILFSQKNSFGDENIEKKTEIINIDNKSLFRGILVNFLSPHPYLFWFTIGIPAMMKTEHAFCRPAFALIFFGVLVPMKIFLAWSVSKGKNRLKAKNILWIMRGLSVTFIYFVYILIREGIRYLQ